MMVRVSGAPVRVMVSVLLTMRVSAVALVVLA